MNSDEQPIKGWWWNGTTTPNTIANFRKFYHQLLVLLIPQENITETVNQLVKKGQKISIHSEEFGNFRRKLIANAKK